MSRTLRAPLVLVCGLLSASQLAAQTQFDQVMPHSGVSTNGKLLSISKTEVRIESRNGARKIPVNEIRRITFANEPTELRRARDSIITGRYATVLPELAQIDLGTIERSEIKQDIQFYLALGQGRQAISSGGDKAQAEAAMLEFVRRFPNSFHFFEAAELLGDLAVSQGKYDAAVKYFGAITGQAPWPEYQLRSGIRAAHAPIVQRRS